MNKYEIWSEGFAATGQNGHAFFHGMSTGTTFKDACDKLFIRDQCYNSGQMTHWGCRLFDNQVDAIKSFG